MENYVVVDIETTGLDVAACRVHCVVLRWLSDDSVEVFRPAEIPQAIMRLNDLASDPSVVLCGHNVIDFDFPVLHRFGLQPIRLGGVYDTLVVSRACYPGTSLAQADATLFKKHPEVRGKFRAGAHTLGAWGYRLGVHKGEYKGGFDEFSEDMLAYCVRDTEVTGRLLQRLGEEIPEHARVLECSVAQIIRRMSAYGVRFDSKAALELAADLTQRRDQLTEELRNVFAPWFTSVGPTVPARSAVSRSRSPGQEGYRNVAAGCPYTKIKLIEFNPASTDHIADRLIKVHRWEPTAYTETGKPQVTAEILRDLPFPEAKALAEYQEIKKVLGYLIEGKNAWLRLERHNRLHGKVLPTGTVSGRASHANPNTGNVPSRSRLGHRCRTLFVASPGRVLVGADAKALQLFILGHYIARWDNGTFAQQCMSGDVHEYLRAGTGLFTRDRQKTWTYYMLFGAQDLRLGRTALDDHRDAFEKGLTKIPIPPLSSARELGKRTRDNLGNAIPAFPKLAKELKRAYARGHLITLDGRKIPIGSEHIAIAMLLQGGEACIMKKAMVIAAPKIYALGGEFVLWVHDEFQVEVDPDKADEAGKTLVEAIRLAGESFGMRITLDGNYKIGNNWGETH